MSKRTPDRKVAQGLTVGSVAGIISAVFMAIFHKHIPLDIVTALPMVLGVLGHFIGSYLAPYTVRDSAVAKIPSGPVNRPL